MTNEEILEEIYFKAHKKGFIDKFREEVDKLKLERSDLSRVDVAQRAYMICKGKC
jgi:hypothetical protein